MGEAGDGFATGGGERKADLHLVLKAVKECLGGGPVELGVERNHPHGRVNGRPDLASLHHRHDLRQEGKVIRPPRSGPLKSVSL